MKIIQINSFSFSKLLKNFEKEIYSNWYAQVAFQLKKYYPKLKIEAWTLEKNYKKEKRKNVKKIKFRIFPTNISIRHSMEISLKMLKALKKEIKNSEKNNEKLIIHFHEYHTWQTYLILSLIKKHKNLKIIGQHHGARSPFKNIIKYKRLFLFLPLIILMQASEYFLFRHIDFFYYQSKEEENYLKKIVSKSKIRFQTIGINNEYFRYVNKKYAKKKLNLDLNKKYILYLGRIKTTKGIKELLDAFKEIKNKNIKLLLVGEGVDFKKYKKYSEEENIENIKFIGPKYGKEKILYLSACDIFVLPSYTEGASVAVMEAMAKNLQIITTNVGGLPKTLMNGKAGILINPYSQEEITHAINKILKKDKKDIKKYAERFKWNKIIKQTYHDYIK